MLLLMERIPAGGGGMGYGNGVDARGAYVVRHDGIVLRQGQGLLLAEGSQGCRQPALALQLVIYSAAGKSTCTQLG